ncbi:MAG TPA: G1 family glutamic endopeptidase [Streptosporangiaceae bacterium]
MRKVLTIAAAAAALLTASGPALAATGATAGQQPGLMVSGLRLAQVTLPRTHLPHLTPHSVVTSSNWSGYAAVAKKGVRLRYVAAHFTIPSVNCTKSKLGSQNVAYASNWVGLDGFNSGTVEQAGVDSFCDQTRTAQYDAWYEMYPLGPVVFSGVNPGDAISVSVYLNGSKYNLALTDLTTGGKFATSASCPKNSTCRDSSAEVITEDPGDAEPVIDLADFGQVNFTGIAVTSANGTRGTLTGNKLWTSSEIVMKNSGGRVMAQPSSLEGGQAFNVSWRASQ